MALMEQKLPTADEFFGTNQEEQSNSNESLPTADEFFSGKTTETHFNFGPGIFGPSITVSPGPAPEVSEFFKNSIPGRISRAFTDQFMGMEAEDVALGIKPGGDVEKALKGAGIFNDYAKGDTSIVKSFNEAIIRPAAVAADSMYRGLTVANDILLRSAEEVGGPAPELAEYFLTTPAGVTPHSPIPPEIHRAQSAGVMDGEAVYAGLKEPTPAQTAARAQADAALPVEPQAAATTPAAPDVHAAARQLDPTTFDAYDRLGVKQDTLRTQLSELSAARTADVEAKIDAINNSPSRTDRRAILYGDVRQGDYALQQLEAKKADIIAAGDTPEMATLRKQIQDLDYQRRDLAPQVSLAYRTAQEQLDSGSFVMNEPTKSVGEPLSANTVGGEDIASSTQTANTGTHTQATQPVNIADDVAKQLIAAGRPAEEANASAQLVASHYKAVVDQGWVKGLTPEEAYQRDMANIKAGREGRVKARELAQDSFDHEMRANLSAATPHIEGINRLVEQANKGDKSSFNLLNTIADESLHRLLSGIGTVHVETQPGGGLFGGSLEPSLGVVIKMDEADRPATLAALAKFADNFRQEQIHVRQPTTDVVGTPYPDGSFATPVYTIDIKQPLSRAEIQSLIDKSGLYGLTYTDGKLEAYYVGSPTDAAAIDAFRTGINTVRQSLGENGTGIEQGIDRLWRYGEGEGTIPYDAIKGDLPATQEGGTEVPRLVAENLLGKEIEPVEQSKTITESQRELQRHIANDYERMPDNDLANPMVKKAYDHLATEIKKQFEALPIKVEAWSGSGEPYKNSAAMRRDIMDNNHLYFYKTEEGKFGPEGVDLTGHPLLEDSGLKDVKGNELLMNDLLRVVHDYYAHVISTSEFGPKGEEAAWRNHMATIDDPWARWALTSETRGQNSWVNFGSHVKEGSALQDRPFARQKVGLLPIEDTLTGNKSVDDVMLNLESSLSPEETNGSISVNNELNQGARGKIRLATEDTKAAITLMKTANASTFIHEIGHHWLDEMLRYAKEADAPQSLIEHTDVVRKWLGSEPGAEITIKQHEKFARGFERYLMEGVAPSKELATVFARFKQWLTDIYQTVQKLRSPITDDIRNVFDRLLTAKTEKTVIADEADAGKHMADIHVNDAIETPPDQAATVADSIRNEVDQLAKSHGGEIYEKLRSADEADGSPTAATGATGDGGSAGSAGQAITEPTAINAGGNGAAAEGATSGGQQPVANPVGGAGDGTSSDAAGKPSTSGTDGATTVGGKPAGGTNANKPPEGPTTSFGRPDTGLVDKAGNIVLKNLNTPEDVNAVLRDTAKQNGDFIEARRGVISTQQQIDLADALGMNSDALNMRKIGQAFNAEQVIAARKLLIQSATDLRDLMAKAANGAEADVMAYAEGKARHIMIQKQVSGFTAEAGRALGAFRKLEGSDEAMALGDFLKQATGKDLFQLQEEAKLGAKLDTTQKISKFINDSQKASFTDMAMEFWINGLLSGPMTHVKNILGNTITSVMSVPETLLTSLVGKVRGATERVELGEAKARLFGIVQGSKDGVQAAWASLKDEDLIEEGSKLEQHRRKAIPSAKFDIGGKELEVGGKQIRLPGRLLTAEDAVFKAIAYRQELNALAYRQAIKEELLEGTDAFNQSIAKNTMSPSEEMMKAATKNADYQTFTKELGKTGRSVMQFANSHPTLKLIIPFIRTPTNILKYAGERTPLGFFSKEVRDNLSGLNGEIARDQQTSRMIIGSTVGVTFATLAAQGHITGGGPKDSAERAVLYATGWQPYSVRVGEMYYSYQWMEPFATIMGVSADAVDMAHAMNEVEAEKIPAMLVGSIAKNLVSKTWLQGPSNLIQMISDPDRYGEAYIQQFAGSIVPGALAQSARVADPILRQSRTVLDTIKSRIPGLSQDLLPRRDVWGEPITREGSLGPDLLSPVFEKRLNQDPVNQALIRLNTYPASLERKIRGVPLTDKQYDDLSRMAGRMAKARLNSVIATSGFETTPPFAQIMVIKSIIDTSREMARSVVMMQNPDIVRQAIQNKLSQIQGKK